ncbi:MAG: TRAP transporter small permease [Candidatus Atribacteria bacterium]|nr:TRAP transporter small permease [Candidatus Atribacteria bacterium]
MKQKLKIEEILSAIILGIMSVIAFGNVLSRYVFHASFAATEEVVVNLFVWMTVLGIAMAFEKGSHLSMTMVTERLSPRGKAVANIVSAVIGVILFVIIDYYSCREIYRDLTIYHTRSEALDIPVWIYTAGIPVFSIFIFKNLIKNVLNSLKLASGGAK